MRPTPLDFDEVAAYYDWFKHVVSVGQDWVWRARGLWDLDRYLEGSPVRRVLDVGCGTGDLSVLAARRFPAATVVAIDFSPAMLRHADRRIRSLRRKDRIFSVRGNAQRLPFRDHSFDLIISGFVARTLPRLQDALAEARRLLRPGGTLFLLDVARPTSPSMFEAVSRYFETVVPILEGMISGTRSRRLLSESFRNVPERRQMLTLLGSAGLRQALARPQAWGVVTTYLGRSEPPEGCTFEPPQGPFDRRANPPQRTGAD